MSIDAMKQALEALEQYTNVVTSVNDPNSWVTVSDGGKPARDAITALRAAIEQAQELVAWREHVEQRLLTWRQSFVNKSGDQLALDDFMDKRSLDDLIDFVCDEYTAPRQWQGLTEEEKSSLVEWAHPDIIDAIEFKLRERNT